MLEIVCASISKGGQGTRSLVPLGKQWAAKNRRTPIAEIRQWFSALDSTHAAHQERVFLNHPRAIIAPHISTKSDLILAIVTLLTLTVALHVDLAVHSLSVTCAYQSQRGEPYGWPIQGETVVP